MPTRKKQPAPVISAQVIIRSQSGETIRGDVPITASNIGRYSPAPDDVEKVQQAFRDAGFVVGNMVGVSFSITAPLSRFERFFRTKLRVAERGEVALKGQDAPAGGLELSPTHLPRDAASRIAGVVFSPAADLHGEKGGILF